MPSFSRRFQVYSYFDGYSAGEQQVVNEVRDRFQEAFNAPNFEPGFTLKVTWSNVTMYPNYESYINYVSVLITCLINNIFYQGTSNRFI